MSCRAAVVPLVLAVVGGLVASAVWRPVSAAPPNQAALATHWSFRPVAPPKFPAVKNSGWPKDDLDRLVLARIEQAGLSPANDADRHTLIRRLSFDLVGLPPTEREIQDFVQDRAGDDVALARLVDRLLASPRFGERWARHWLDVARYADNTGRSWNAPLTYAFRYRDYVIDAYNRDTPFDRFVLEQLAGDLLPAAAVDDERRQLTATGFLALGAVDLSNGSREGFVLDQIDDQIDVTTRAFLGLSISCARCHDHKYDPITQRDYYALAGVFYSTRTRPGVASLHELGRNMYVDPAKLLALPRKAGEKPSDELDLVGIHSMGDFQDEFRRGLRDIKFDTHPDLALGVLERAPRDCEIRIQGEPYERDVAPPRGDLRVPGLPRMATIPTSASGRLELARWVASRDNPLTARVYVNRVWQHLFGKGIVSTVDDFGSTGELPTHPELLDHLAARLVAEGWSTKTLIRAIVLSRTYRQSSAVSPAVKDRDAQNLHHSRMDLRRLELEPLRDSLLAASGRLTFARPEGIQVAGTGGKGRAGQVRSLLSVDAPYRTVYLPVLRSLLPEMYGAFDFPSPTQVEGKRHVTTVATQALFLMNSDFAIDCADDAAERLLDDSRDERERVRLAFLRLLTREPTTDELAAARRLLASLDPPSGTRDPERYKWSALVQALMASAEFRYVR